MIGNLGVSVTAQSAAAVYGTRASLQIIETEVIGFICTTSMSTFLCPLPGVLDAKVNEAQRKSPTKRNTYSARDNVNV